MYMYAIFWVHLLKHIEDVDLVFSFSEHIAIEHWIRLSKPVPILLTRGYLNY
jgi:hypothetical protein